MKELRKLCSAGSSILGVSVSPDGSEAACGTLRCNVIFCRLNGEGSPEPVEYRGGLVRYSTDGLVFGSSIDEVLIISYVKTGRFIRRIEWHKNAILDMAFSPDGTMIACGGKRELIICNVNTGMPVQKFEVSAIISGIRYTPEGTRLITSSQDGVVSIWDCKTAEKVREMKGHTDTSRCVAVSFDGMRILSGAEDNLMILWDAHTGEPLHKYDCCRPVWSVVFTPDGRHALCGCHNSLVLWDLASGNILDRHDEEIRSSFFVDMVPDGEHAVSGSLDGSFRHWALYE
jgi:WD40 repeat protein